MKSRLALNLGLLALIAILAAVAVLKPGKKEEPQPTLVAGKLDALSRVTLQNKEKLTFEKMDGLWWLTAPFAAPVNQVRMRQLLEVGQAVSSAHYPIKPGELAQFGLNQPQATLNLGDNMLQFGTTDPINMRRYVRIGDTLHLVDDNFFHHLTASATDYVDKKLIPEGAKIRQIELPGLKAMKGADGHWTAESAGDGKTDWAELASTWATARAIEVKRLEKDSQGDTIRITLHEGPPVEFVILRKEPALTLARRDLGLQYEITADTSRDLLNQKQPDQEPADSSPKRPGEAHDQHDDDHEEEEYEGEGLLHGED
jgi:hypothetical protein